MHHHTANLTPPTNRVRQRLLMLAGAVLMGAALAAAPAAAAPAPLTRFPTLHGSTIVFEAGGNLWRVDRSGGVAQRLTSNAGLDLVPRFSPDGSEIAFTGNYDGNTDVYVIPAEGGPARRLTFHSDTEEGEAPLRWGPDNMVVTWTPNGKDILFLSRRTTFNSWFGQLYLVSKDGGLPSRLDVPKGGMTSYSPDGKQIVYNRIFRNFRTWKGYYGGLAQDVWLYDLTSHDIQRLTDWKGTDTFPMWYGDTVYFASDRGPAGRLNIWALDLKTRQAHQVTHFADYDVDWPSLGDTGIVLQCGGALWVVDLPSEQLHKVDVTVPSDGVRTRPRWVDASQQIRSFDIAPNGKRALFGARGEVFTVPAKHGNTRDLTQSSGAREEYPAWSPDGKLVAYVTDRDGEAQVAIRPADGSGSETVLTTRDAGYLYGPAWSPDSAKLAFSDSDHVLWYLDVGSRKVVKVDQDPREEIHHVAWSPDARWIAYTKAGPQDMGSDDDASTYMGRIFLYNLADGTTHQVSDGMTDDREPVFDPVGRYLYFLSDRHPNPVFSQTEFNIATLKMTGVYAATLRAGEASPFAPRSDEGLPAAGEEASPKKETWRPGASTPLEIDVAGLMKRAVPLPVPAGNIHELTAARDRVYYLTRPTHAMSGPLAGEQPQLHVFDMTKRTASVLASPVDAYALSADGEHVLTETKNAYSIRPAVVPDKVAHTSNPPSTLDLSGMRALVDPVAEWHEMFGQAWRLERDFFFNQKMNGIDWPAVRARYAKLLPQASCREDLNYLIGEMLGELHNSHTYVGGGDNGHPDPVATGLLGVDFALDGTSGRYFFKKIYPGDNSREEERSPLTEPGVNVKEGSYLLAVDGHELRAPTNPYSLFVNTLGRTVTLTVADDSAGSNRRDVTVRPIRQELDLRLAAWIAHNRQEVAEASHGAIGYLYLSDMDEVGMNQFIRQFYPQTDRQGLVVDVRYNGGGEIDQIILERLRRRLVGMATNREGVPFTIPEQVLHGHMACLANHYSASDGDIFPYYFKKYGLGPVIGERTWGGVRGIRGYWPLADGGYITIPEDSLYGLDSQWVIENHGVEPDMEVDDLPGEVMAGHDAQLDAAVREIMKALASEPMKLPARPPLLPAYPPKGM